MSVMVTLPTYNEAGNILPLIRDLFAIRSDLSIVVIDDDSPDGTHRIVREEQNLNPRLFLIHRTGERGRGTAGIEGFRFALEKKADFIVEMDADYSHHPRFIPSMVEASHSSG